MKSANPDLCGKWAQKQCVSDFDMYTAVYSILWLFNETQFTIEMCIFCLR